MTFHLPIIITSSRLCGRDMGGRGPLRGPRNNFRHLVLQYRNYLCMVEMYSILRTHAEMRRVQEMLYAFIIQNGGRLIKEVPHRAGYYYVLSHHAAMTVMSRMLHEGHKSPIGTFPVDDDIDEDLNVLEMYRQFSK